MQCHVTSDGLYIGQDVEVDVVLSTEFRFLYQIMTVPSVTVTELNQDMLPKVELDMGDQLLPKLYFQPNAARADGTYNNNSSSKGLLLLRSWG